jgi:hypothetical protein
LTAPFYIENIDEQDDGGEYAEKFIQEKSELMGLLLCIMLENKKIFKYLWTNCSFIWNDTHLVLLANFIFDA